MNLAVELARSGEGLKSGPIALAVILVLCVVCYFLFKSMSKHLKNVRDDFPAESAQGARPSTTPPATAPTTTPPTTTPTAILPGPASEDSPERSSGPAPAE